MSPPALSRRARILPWFLLALSGAGGCGSKGTAGSGAQRAALLLVDGPPPEIEEAANQTLPTDLVFTGDAHSHNFPSVAQINVEVTKLEDDTVVIALSGSDGTGDKTIATAVGDGKWVVSQPIFMGTGWGATSDPFNQLAQQRTLIIADDGKSATYQDMGADTALELVTDEEDGWSGEEDLPAGPGRPEKKSRGPWTRGRN